MYKYIAAELASSGSSSRRHLLLSTFDLTDSASTSTLLSSAAADPSVPQVAGMSSSIASTAQLSALLTTQIQAATSAGADSGASLTSILTNVAQLSKAAASFQSDINNGGAAPTAAALRASAATQVVDTSLIASVVSSAASSATAAEAMLASAVTFTIQVSNPATFWSAAVITSAQTAVSAALLAACIDQNAALSTNVSSITSLARRRLTAGSSATSKTVGFTNTVDLGVARDGSSSLLNSLAAALGGVGLTGVSVAVATTTTASPSSSSGTTNTTSGDTSSSSSGPSTTTVAIAVAVSVGVGAALVGAVVFFVCRKRTSRAEVKLEAAEPTRARAPQLPTTLRYLYGGAEPLPATENPPIDASELPKGWSAVDIPIGLPSVLGGTSGPSGNEGAAAAYYSPAAESTLPPARLPAAGGGGVLPAYSPPWSEEAAPLPQVQAARVGPRLPGGPRARLPTIAGPTVAFASLPPPPVDWPL